MLVVRVANMAVTVLHRLRHMFMLVVFGEGAAKRPKPSERQRSRTPSRSIRRVVQGNGRADEGRGRGASTGARRAQAAQSKHEEHQADAVAEKADSQVPSRIEHGGQTARRARMPARR